MLDPIRVWNVGQLVPEQAARTRRRQDLAARWRLQACGDGVFQQLSFGVRYDDRDAESYSPQPGARAVPGGPQRCRTLPAGMITDQRRLLRRRQPTCRPAGWSRTATTSTIIATKCARCTASPPADRRCCALFDVTGKNVVGVRADAICEFGDKFHGEAGRALRQGRHRHGVHGPDHRPVLRRHARASTIDVLPSVTLRYDVTDDCPAALQLRRNVAPPDFSDLNPNFALTGDLTQRGLRHGHRRQSGSRSRQGARTTT